MIAEKNGKRVGILTSGGDAPGMNGAVRATFRRIKAMNPKNEVILFKEGLNGLAGRLEVNHLESIQRQAMRGIMHKGGTFIGTGRIPELKPCPADYPDPEAWNRRRAEITDVAVVNLRQLGLDAIIVIGGEGSFKGLSYIVNAYEERYKENLTLIGVPGTIDNDIWGTEATIGFDTALNNTVDALRKLRDTIESHRRCVILEVMGNTSGWLALAAGIAGGVTTIMIPERPESYDLEQVLARIRPAIKLKYRSIIVVMAEGVKKASKNPRIAEDLRQKVESDPVITKLLGRPLETRVNIIGYIARGGQPSARDNLLASQLGYSAASAAIDGGMLEPIMVGIQRSQVVWSAMKEVIAHSPRLIEEDAELWSIAQSLLISADQTF
jgi:6-phosphofructokinase 1